jgi:hypothetical protein
MLMSQSFIGTALQESGHSQDARDAWFSQLWQGKDDIRFKAGALQLEVYLYFYRVQTRSRRRYPSGSVPFLSYLEPRD